MEAKMPIDPSKALGAELGEGQYSWTQDDVILYHLGIGAGVPATDARELGYTYEKNLRVLPSFGVIPVFGAMGGMGNVEGLSFNFAMLLHGEQDITLHKPLPAAATVTNRSRVAELWDKGKAALCVLEVDSRDESGEPLFTNRFSLFLRGEGGFGGEPGPKAGNERPERDADGVVESVTIAPAGPALPPLGRQEPPARRSRDRQDGGLRQAHHPWPVLFRHRVQSGGGRRIGRRHGPGGPVPGAFPRRGLPRRNLPNILLARGRQDSSSKPGRRSGTRS